MSNKKNKIEKILKTQFDAEFSAEPNLFLKFKSDKKYGFYLK